jgi:hypothetical protein
MFKPYLINVWHWKIYIWHWYKSGCPVRRKKGGVAYFIDKNGIKNILQKPI